jgi:hypothetical protein
MIPYSLLSDSSVAKKQRRRVRKPRKSVCRHGRHSGTGLCSVKFIGTTEDVEKFSRRQVRVTKEHNEECRKLLGLMGIPVVIVRVFNEL